MVIRPHRYNLDININNNNLKMLGYYIINKYRLTIIIINS